MQHKCVQVKIGDILVFFYKKTLNVFVFVLEQQIIKKEDCKYSSVIGDFNSSDMTVFDRSAVTYWKPALLVSGDHMRLFAYLVIYRYYFFFQHFIKPTGFANASKNEVSMP